MSGTGGRRELLLLALLAMSGCLYIQKNLVLAPQLHRNDFKHLYIGAFLVGYGADLYDPGRAFWAKEKLGIPGGINPFVYPPFMALLARPLAWFSFDTAWFLWCGLNNLLLVLTLVLFCGLWPNREFFARLTIGVALVALYDPIFRTISAGQFNIVLLFAFTLSLVWLESGRPVPAGLLLGTMASAKVSPALLLVPFLLIDRRAFVAMLGAIFACTGLAVVLTGVSQHISFLRVVGEMTYGRSTWEQFGMTYHVEPANQAPSAVFYRLLTENPKTSPWCVNPAAAYTLSISTAAIILVTALRVSLRTHRDRSILFALWFYPMLLIPSLCWDHYFTQLLLPIWVLASKWKSQPRWRCGLFALALGLLSVPYNFESTWWKEGIGILGASVKCAAALVLYWLTLHRALAENGPGVPAKTA